MTASVGHNGGPSLDDQIIEMAAACQYDPLAWAHKAWDWGVGALEGHKGPRAWQADIMGVIRDHLMNSATRYQPLRIAVASGHGIGKSAGMSMIADWGMSCFGDAKIVVTANTDTQMKTKTSPEMGKWFKSSITSHWWDVQATSIKSRSKTSADSWRVDFVPWSEHNTEAFAGLHNMGRIIILMFDEASKIHDKVWEVAEGAMTDENTVIIWIAFGNPTRNSGRFRECFRKFKNRWITRQIDSRTVEGTNAREIAKWAEDYGEDSDFFKVRVRGQFPMQSATQFISTEDADRAQKVHLRPQQYNFAPKIIGVDPAWTGDDPLTIYLRQGLYSKRLLTMPRNDNDVQVANIIARLEDEHDADAVFVDAGYGTGIVSAGQVMGRTWRLIWFGSKSPDPGYLNMRSYMAGQLKAWLKAGGAIDPANQELYDQICSVETVERLDGIIQLMSKKDMKEKLFLPSPNDFDGLGLTFAEPVGKKSRSAGRLQLDDGRHIDMVAADYDPLAL